jgi:hypothetical protein
MIYPRAKPAMNPDMERLYALGIDAFRLLQIMLDSSYQRDLPLDGVTGHIQLGSNNLFQRESIPALFNEGRGLTPEALAAMIAAKAAEAEAAKVPEAEAVKAPASISAPLPTVP